MLSGPFTVQRSRTDSSYLATTGMPGWGYGVVDPSSGTAIMMEVGRVLDGLETQTVHRVGQEVGIMGSADDYWWECEDH